MSNIFFFSEFIKSAGVSCLLCGDDEVGPISLSCVGLFFIFFYLGLIHHFLPFYYRTHTFSANLHQAAGKCDGSSRWYSTL